MKHSAWLAIAGFLGCSAFFTQFIWAEELSKTGRTAFRLHRDGMNSALIADFNYGRGLFHHDWAPVEYSDGTTSGFGPLYNANSCVACHVRDGRGHPPEVGNIDSTSFVLRLSVGSEQVGDYKRVTPDPTYGFQFQTRAISGVEPEGQISVRYQEHEVVMDGGEIVFLRTPTYELVSLGYGPLHDDFTLGPRVAPQLIGLGLLEQIPVSRLVEMEDELDQDQDGISGVINWSFPNANGERLPGRFGWKLTATSVRQQSDMAANADMGLSTPFASNLAGDCTDIQVSCLAIARQDHFGKSIELDEGDMRLLAFYTANLRVPERRDENTDEIIRGQEIFGEIGCAACHVEKHNLENETEIFPFTDLLLHDMGPGLADGIEVGSASFSEWRTAPLWGIGMTEIVSEHTFFLHDGRARNLTEAIVWHGGEALTARNGFLELQRAERQDLLGFLNSL